MKKIFCLFMAAVFFFSPAMPALQTVAMERNTAEEIIADNKDLLPELPENRQTATEKILPEETRAETEPAARDADTPAPMAENSEETQPADGRWIAYIADRNPTAKTAAEYRVCTDSSGALFTLEKDGETVTYNKALLAKPSANGYSSIYFTDIQENGYEFFESDIGIYSAHKTGGGVVNFKIYADGQPVFSREGVTAADSARHISLPLEGVQVLQLVVESAGANTGDMALWADARFVSSSQKPYLAVDDLEFNLPSQVTRSNILEYVSARDADGNDISDSITYTTDYAGQPSGTFTVTYTVTDGAGGRHSRSVKMTVTGEDYSAPLTLERLKKPWASYLYHGRGTLSTQSKKAWDLFLTQLLDFNPSKWEKISRWNENVYKVEIDLQAAGIFALKSELSSLSSMFMDDEPRTFVLKDWGCDITEKDGLAYKVTMWAPMIAENQDRWLEKIEANTAEMLSAVKDDMSEIQRLKAASDKYKAWLRYGNNGQLLTDSLGGGIAVCGGNARGYIYLSQRLGIKSVWGRSGSHAWSFTKIRDIDYWFKTDLLSGEFLAPGVNGEGNLTVQGNYKTRHYKWFEFGTLEYPRNLLKYPSVWVNLSAKNAVIAQGAEYDLMTFVNDFGSIYTNGMSKNSITVTVDKVDKDGNLIKKNLKGFDLSSPACDFGPGYYRVNYTLTDKGKTNSAGLYVRVADGEKISAGFEDRLSSTGTSGIQKPLGLWDGSRENWYESGIYLNEAASVTFDVADKGYKYVSFDYGIKDSVRQNVQWGSNGIVAAKVSVTLADGTQQVIHEGKSLGWKTAYESVFAAIPENAVSLTITNVKIGAGNNHGGIGGLRFIKDSGTTVTLSQENPPRLTADKATIKDTDNFDRYSLFAATDGEDGDFALTADNFVCEMPPKSGERFVPGTYKLSYTLTDTDDNNTAGTLTLTVKNTQVSSSQSSGSGSRTSSSQTPGGNINGESNRPSSAVSGSSSAPRTGSSSEKIESSSSSAVGTGSSSAGSTDAASATAEGNIAKTGTVIFLACLAVTGGGTGIVFMLKKHREE